jgi:hypothetical protein
MDGKARLSKFLTAGDPNKGSGRPAELTRRSDDFQTLIQELIGG